MANRLCAIPPAAAGLCRQLANRDAVKGALAAAGAFDLACSTAAAHSASMPVLEQVHKQSKRISASPFDLVRSTAAVHCASMPVLELVHHKPCTLLARILAWS
jgi:hypothetical protein